MIDVITGPMFSGKTGELIRRVKAYEVAGLKCIAFKPEIESRNEDENNGIATHDRKDAIKAVMESNPIDIARKASDYDVIAIDEAQFFEPYLYLVLKALQEADKIVIVSGLDLDYEMEPFTTMANIMAIAQKIDKYTAVCNDCRQPAQYSKRVSEEKGRVLIGGDDKYAANCLKCFYKSN